MIFKNRGSRRNRCNCRVNCAISILAGGLSTRMGRDKARLRLGANTLLTTINHEARRLGLPVRIIRRDLVPRCGPLGGIYTALKTSKAAAELFLACDMPFVSTDLLASLLETWKTAPGPVFMVFQEKAGFPFVLPAQSLAKVEGQIRAKRFSLQRLAESLNASFLHPAPEHESQLFNINTAKDWEVARQRLATPKSSATPVSYTQKAGKSLSRRDFR